MFESPGNFAGIGLIAFFLAVIACGCPGHAQQTTGQLLISSGFNPIAATTPENMARLTSLPAKQFVLRSKGNRPYYVHADPAGCGCAYVGSVAAMNRYRISFGQQPAGALPPPDGGVSGLEQSMINGMDQDDASAQFNNDVFGPNF
jgi:hypothetical protein